MYVCNMYSPLILAIISALLSFNGISAINRVNIEVQMEWTWENLKCKQSDRVQPLI